MSSAEVRLKDSNILEVLAGTHEMIRLKTSSARSSNSVISSETVRDSRDSVPCRAAGLLSNMAILVAYTRNQRFVLAWVAKGSILRPRSDVP